MKDLIEIYVRRHIMLTEQVFAERVNDIAIMGDALVECLTAGGRIYVCGNGGSAADAQHFAAELVGRFVRERRALPAVALTTDTSILTAVSNDYGFERVFARQIEALCRPGDLVFGLSTSGNSSNVEQAFIAASKMGCRTAALLGGDGGRIGQLADTCIVIPDRVTAHIQEAHIMIIHLLCLIVDEHFAAAS